MRKKHYIPNYSLSSSRLRGKKQDDSFVVREAKAWAKLILSIVIAYIVYKNTIAKW